MEILIKGGVACSIPNWHVFSDEDQIRLYPSLK
jgi:hypothetical protein